jgi:glucosamine-6-phosphate deaminase
MVPASVLQPHPHVRIVLDDEAAAQLQLAGCYRSVYSTKPAWQHL